jgi:hypothetical protein
MPNRAPRRWPHAMQAGVAALALALVLAACGPGGTPPPVGDGVEVDVAVTGLGRVSYAAGALQCTGSCAWTVPDDRAIAIVAEPQGSHVFAGWGGTCDVFPNPCQGTFAEGDRVTATFAPHALRLDLTGDGEGVFSILGGGVQATCDADCFVAMSMPLQVAITYAAQGSTGTTLGDWTGPCDPGTVQPGYCLVSVTGVTEIGKAWARAPTAVDDAYAAARGQTLVVAAPGVLANDTPAGSLAAELVTDVAHGTLALAADGGFAYTPEPGFDGEDGFAYRVRNAVGQTDTATVTITVVRDAPVANADAYATDRDVPLTIAAPGVLANDAGTGGVLSAVLASDVDHGTLSLAPDGGFVYTPDAGYVGGDGFTYRAADGSLESAPATVTITVRDVAAPTALDDAFDATAGVALIVAPPGVLANDGLGSSGDPIVAELVGDVTSGDLDLASNGGFVYTADPGFDGTDAFTYRAFDGSLRSAVATVTITVRDGVAVADASTDDDAHRGLDDVADAGLGGGR